MKSSIQSSVFVIILLLCSCRQGSKANETIYRASMDKLIEEIWNNQQLDILQEVFTDDAILHFDDADKNLQGRTNFRENYMQLTMKAFPDIHHGYDKLLIDGNMVAMMFYGEGTHKGEYEGVPATNKHLRYRGLALFRMEGNKIAEVWTYSNWASKFAELHTSDTGSQINVSTVKLSVNEFSKLLTSDINLVINHNHVLGNESMVANRSDGSKGILRNEEPEITLLFAELRNN